MSTKETQAECFVARRGEYWSENGQQYWDWYGSSPTVGEVAQAGGIVLGYCAATNIDGQMALSDLRVFFFPDGSWVIDHPSDGDEHPCVGTDGNDLADVLRIWAREAADAMANAEDLLKDAALSL